MIADTVISSDAEVLNAGGVKMNVKATSKLEDRSFEKKVTGCFNMILFSGLLK